VPSSDSCIVLPLCRDIIYMQRTMRVQCSPGDSALEHWSICKLCFVTDLILQAGKLLDLQYVDPYAAEIYDVQQQKWSAKQKREADRQVVVAARATSASA